jgi:prepilin-type N-terminal cleavage/methylation domain-containing protein
MKQRRGYTLIELVLVLLLLVLVAAGVFTLAAAGSQAYLKLSDQQTLTAELRTGLSYLDVQIRKHDAFESLSIRQDPFQGGQALVIGQLLEDETYLTWIYVRDGYLCELFVKEGIAVTPDMASKIVRMDLMKLEQVSSDALLITLVRQPAESLRQESSRLVYLRAGGISP